TRATGARGARREDKVARPSPMARREGPHPPRRAFMRVGVRFAASALAAVAGLGVSWLGSSAQEKPKDAIKDVMQQAHKAGLLKTVLAAQANKEQREMLAEMYTALTQNKPPRGDEKSWKEKTEVLATAATALAKDANDKEAMNTLKKSINCMECHTAH